MTTYEPEYKKFYIIANGLKIRSKRTLTFKAYDKLIDTITNLPHSAKIFFWRSSTSFFIRFSEFSKCDVSDILKILVIIAGLNLNNGSINFFTDTQIIWQYEHPLNND